MKKIILLFLVLRSFNLFAQKVTTTANTVIAKDAIKLNGTKVSKIDTSMSVTTPTHDGLPTSLAVKNYVMQNAGSGKNIMNSNNTATGSYAQTGAGNNLAFVGYNVFSITALGAQLLGTNSCQVGGANSMKITTPSIYGQSNISILGKYLKAIDNNGNVDYDTPYNLANNDLTQTALQDRRYSVAAGKSLTFGDINPNLSAGSRSTGFNIKTGAVEIETNYLNISGSAQTLIYSTGAAGVAIGSGQKPLVLRDHTMGLSNPLLNSNPTGKYLKAIDINGKVEWTDLPAAPAGGLNSIVGGDGIYTTVNGSSAIVDLGAPSLPAQDNLSANRFFKYSANAGLNFYKSAASTSGTPLYFYGEDNANSDNTTISFDCRPSGGNAANTVNHTIRANSLGITLNPTGALAINTSTTLSSNSQTGLSLYTQAGTMQVSHGNGYGVRANNSGAKLTIGKMSATVPATDQSAFNFYDTKINAPILSSTKNTTGVATHFIGSDANGDLRVDAVSEILSQVPTLTAGNGISIVNNVVTNTNVNTDNQTLSRPTSGTLKLTKLNAPSDYIYLDSASTFVSKWDESLNGNISQIRPTHNRTNSGGSVKVGINTPNITGITEALEVVGNIKTTNLQMTTGAATNSILVGNASGNASWSNTYISSGKFGGINSPTISITGATIGQGGDQITGTWSKFGDIVNVNLQFRLVITSVSTGDIPATIKISNLALGSLPIPSGFTSTVQGTITGVNGSNKSTGVLNSYGFSPDGFQGGLVIGCPTVGVNTHISLACSFSYTMN
jgi:hypothetical protein